MSGDKRLPANHEQTKAWVKMRDAKKLATRDRMTVAYGEVNARNASQWLTTWRLTVTSMVRGIGTDDEPQYIPQILAELTHRISLWCDMGQCAVSPDALWEMQDALAAFCRGQSFYSAYPKDERLARANLCSKLLPKATRAVTRMATVAAYKCSGEVDFTPTSKKELRAILGRCNGTLQKWLKKHAADIKSESVHSKQIWVRSSLFEQLQAESARSESVTKTSESDKM